MSPSIMITGWGQVTQPKQATPPYLEPIDMMEHAARDAAAQAGVGALKSIDTILVVRPQSRVPKQPGEELARLPHRFLEERLSAHHVAVVAAVVEDQTVPDLADFHRF